MATFIAIVIVLDFVALSVLYYIVNPRDDKSSEGLITIVLVPSVIFALGVHYDLNGKLVPSPSDLADFALIFSLATLGVTTSIILLSVLFRGGSFSRFNVSGANFIGFLLTIIGLISSLLGIASFYLDYLR